jgi:hypothetical protein
MLARQAAGKMISQNNLIALQEQAAREQAGKRIRLQQLLAAQNASTGMELAKQQEDINQLGVVSDSFMSGSGTAADMGSILLMVVLLQFML